MDEPSEKPERLTVGELPTRIALDQPGAAASKLDLSGFEIARGLTAAKLDLAGLATYPGLTKLDLAGLTAAARPKFTVGEVFSAYWRDQLGNAGIKAQGSIAGQMSQVIAGMKLPGIGLAGIDPTLLTGNLGGVLSGTLSDIAKNIGAGLAASIRPLALLATRGFAEIWQAESELERKADQALFEMGWWLPPTARMDFAGNVWRLALAGDRLAVRAEMNEASHSREFVRVVSRDWMRLPVFAARRRFFLDALADHRHGRYRVSIPTLLPHLEGIAMAAFAPAAKNAKMGKVITEAAAYDSLMGDAMVKVVTTLWDSEGFVELSPADRRLNRQRILHGRSTGYGTAVNSTKLLFTFDLLASLVEQKERQTKLGPRRFDLAQVPARPCSAGRLPVPTYRANPATASKKARRSLRSDRVDVNSTPAILTVTGKGASGSPSTTRRKVGAVPVHGCKSTLTWGTACVRGLWVTVAIARPALNGASIVTTNGSVSFSP